MLPPNQVRALRSQNAKERKTMPVKARLLFMNYRFTVDRKLDNKREPINAQLIFFEYKMFDENITEQVITYKSKSGYCLNAIQKPGQSGFHTVSIDDIGKLVKWGGQHGRLTIYCYPDRKNDGLELIKQEIRMRKARLLMSALSIRNF